MTRAETTLAFLAVLAAACGPATPKLTIRADFTSAEAITTFGMRERILAGQAPGRVTVSTLDGVDFPTVQAAIDRAPPGSVVTIPEGRYEEHLVLEDKVLRLEGAGAARTAVIAAQTALWVSGGEVEVRGLTLVSRSVAESTAVTAFTDTRSRLTDCRVLGGTGPGVLVGGTSTVYLEGNTVTGNMGGGVLVTGGAVTSFRNTLVRNAVAGWVFSPTSHTAIGSVLLDHDTVLDNWSGPRCLSMARRGLIPPEVLAERIRLRGSILNAGGVDECLGPAAAEALRRGALSFFSDGPLPAAGFFRSQDPWDLTPSREIAQKDRDGLELGATPSPEAAERLAAQAQRSLLEGKPWRAYLLSRFLHEEERLRLEAAVQKAIYDQTGSVLGQERVGIFLHNVLALAERVPPSWRLDVLAARLAQAFAAAHRTRVESFELFAAAPPAFRQALEARLAAGLSALPAVLTDQETGARKLMLSGALQGGPRQRLEVAPFQVAETVQNTGIPRLSEKIAFLRGRTDSRGKKIRELDATVSNPHLFPPGKDEKRKEILQDQLAKLREEQAGEEATLAALVAERDAAPPTFEVRLSGAVSRRIVEGEVRLSLITAPSGEILLDSTETLRREDTWLQVDPLPALGFPGLAAAVPGGDPAALLAERTAEAFLLGIARGLVKELEVQISRWERGLTDDANREQLVELVYLHAPALAAARQARPRYEELLRLLASTPADAAPVSLELAYDPARGAGEQGVSLTVLPAPPRAALEDERLRLETLHQTCWTLEPRLATILRDLLGTDLDEVLRHRGTLDRLMAR